MNFYACKYESGGKVFSVTLVCDSVELATHVKRLRLFDVGILEQTFALTDEEFNQILACRDGRAA